MDTHIKCERVRALIITAFALDHAQCVSADDEQEDKVEAETKTWGWNGEGDGEGDGDGERDG